MRWPGLAAPFDMSRIAAADEAGERPDRRQTLIAGLDGTSALILEISEELQHKLGSEIADGQPVHGLAQVAADEGQQQLKVSR